MKRHYLLILLTVFLVTPVVQADSGLIVKKSAHSVEKTLDRLEDIVKKKGATVFTRLDHAKSAKSVGTKLRTTQLLIFGNPKLGSHFLTSNQQSGIDLPMKAIAWEDEKGQVWIGYNDPQYIVDRHGIKNRAEIVNKMRNALEIFISAAAAP
jgi:uncharacterized protein (DUF302 family)